jgi:HemY protein
MTSVAAFRAEVDSALARLRKGLPKTAVLLASVPDLYRLWELGRRNAQVVQVWDRLDVCPSMFAAPTSTAPADADRRRAVLLTAQAQALEDSNPDRAIALAMEAHTLALDLVEPAAIAGRLFSSRGQTAKVARVIEQTWKRAPHPDLAIAYAYARSGDSPRDRLERVKNLARTTPHSVEAPIAVASTAIEAHDWAEARKALTPLLEGRLSQRVCTLMARIEGEQFGNAGRVREWLARAANAPRDPAWTADGFVAERWGPVSPVTGALDAFQWKVPVEQPGTHDEELALAKLEELIALGDHTDKAIEAAPVEEPAVVVEMAPTRADAPTTTPRPAAPAVAASPPVAAAAPTPSKTAKVTTAAAVGNGTASGSRPFMPTRPPDDPGVDSDDEPVDITRSQPAPVAETSKH